MQYQQYIHIEIAIEAKQWRENKQGHMDLM